MTYGIVDIAITPAVCRAQAEMGADRLWVRLQGAPRIRPVLDERNRVHRTARQLLYGIGFGNGRPYVQHRGGPQGFLKVLDDRTLAFIDHRGNRLYISTGNLAENDRTCLFLMDYPARTRLKIRSWNSTRTRCSRRASQTVNMEPRLNAFSS